MLGCGSLLYFSSSKGGREETEIFLTFPLFWGWGVRGVVVVVVVVLGESELHAVHFGQKLNSTAILFMFV